MHLIGFILFVVLVHRFIKSKLSCIIPYTSINGGQWRHSCQNVNPTVNRFFIFLYHEAYRIVLYIVRYTNT